MADFALILRAVDEILGTRGLAQYIDRQRAFALDSISSDPFILVLLDMCDDFTGTSAELLSRMSDRIPDRPSRDWPSNARAVTTLLKRNAPALRKAGWYVSNDGAHNQTNAIRWTLKPPENKRNPSSCDSSCSHTDEATSDTSHEYEPSQDERCSHCDGEGCHWCDADEVRL
jgi:hypothetical protein